MHNKINKMKLSRIVGSFVLIFLSIEVSGQIILNGDFENHTFTNCQTNLPNIQYTSAMSNSWGFGNNDELDVQDNSCGFAIPQSNNWFVSLSKRPTGEYDEFSLEISAPLIVGEVYEINYLEFATDKFGNSNIPLEIGLSSDSISFGTLIHSSIPNLNAWTLQSFTFTAPHNGQYLTVRIDSAGVLKGWNFVDKFEILNTTGIEEILHLNTKVYPNPAHENITIESDFHIDDIIIYDMMANEVLLADCNEAKRVQVNVSKLLPGCYLLKIRGDDKKKYKMKKLCIIKAMR